MDASLIGSSTVELLSRLTGQTLHQPDLTPPIVFLSPLITVLTGVMLADKTATDEEKQRWQKTIKQFLPPERSALEFAQSLSRGIREQKIYIKPDELLKLTQPLSAAERLLLLGLGYEMSASDGQISGIEKRYLQAIAKHLSISSNHLAIIEAGFSGQAVVDQAALREVRSLLDPARFHELDPLFVKAASDLLAALPVPPEIPEVQNHSVTSYAQLREFQQRQKQLDNLCYQLYQIIQACVEQEFLGNYLIETVNEISRKLQSQRFRLAVIGEFSQGKSTLLNALLGEKIQPTRMVPCSGTVTILKYGSQKRVVCRYKDGREEEIPVQNYQDKAAIPRDIAQGQRTESLSESDIDEIIYEHPDLALCQSGVEIVDSPGLNEHPDRTAITQKLLQDTDAAIFLTNAMRLLPEKEKELIQDVRIQLTGDRSQTPVENLFILVNFIDLVDEREDRQDITARLEGFIRSENLLSLPSDRVHYISAKAALEATLKQTDNEYLYAFQDFTQALENFLTLERGSLKIAQAGRDISRLLEMCFSGLIQAESSFDGRVDLSEAGKQKILDQIGEASGREVKVRRLAKHLTAQVLDQAIESWNVWLEQLPKQIVRKSEYWHSEHSPVWSQKQLIQDYIDLFIYNLSQEIDAWSSKQFVETILKQSLEVMDASIYLELEAIQTQFNQVDLQVNTGLSKQINLAISEISDDFVGAGGFLGGIGAGGALAATLIFFTPIGLIGVIVATLATAIAGSFGFGMLDLDGLRNQIKAKVLELGFQIFNQSIPKVHEKLEEIITSVFDRRVESTSRVISQAISLYETLLEQQEKSHAATLEQRGQQKALIAQKQQELEQVKQAVETLLSQFQNLH